jgi:hypothetical protein
VLTGLGVTLVRARMVPRPGRSNCPDVHAGKDYWMSTDVLNGAQAADILTDALGQTIQAEVFSP